ncbi:MAG: hypothetical protein FJZ62_06245 [Chlamydiae bacterium]|nr:hypothetical protein [Chlamydiota bacterium]
MKKILLLTVFAFGLADFMVMEDCYAAVESSTGTTNLSKSQKKRLRKKASADRKAQAASGSIAAAEGTTAMVPPSTPSRDQKESSVLAIKDAEPQLALAGVETGPSLAAAGSSDESAVVLRTVGDPKAQKAWDKKVASVKGTLGILKGAVDQLYKSAEAYKSTSPDDQIKEQNAIEGSISSILKSIESIQGSIGFLDRLTVNESVQKYLAAFVKDLTAKTKDAFLSMSRRVDPAKVTVTTGNIGAIKAKLESLSQFLSQHRTFWGTLKGWNGTGQVVVKPAVTGQAAVVKGDKTVTKEVKAKEAVMMDLEAFYDSVFAAKTKAQAAEDPFKPTVDEKMFEGKKDKDLVKTLGILQGIIRGLIEDLTKTLEALSVKEASLKKKTQFLIKKVQASSEMKKTATDLDTMLYMKKASDVKNILVQLETYRQELEHMVEVTKKSQEKSAGSVQAQADYELIVTFHETLDKVLGAMVVKVVESKNVQPLVSLFQQWMPKKEETLKILKPEAKDEMPKKEETLKVLKPETKDKQAKLKEIRDWLTTLKTVRV